MNKDLFPYYDLELRFLRRDAEEFAKKHTAAAGLLGLEADRAKDPHVERFLQGCAFLAARIHRKLDDEFPELTGALFEVLYPHYLAPIPSMAIVRFEANPGATQVAVIDRYSKLRTKEGIAYSDVDKNKKIQIEFQTCYPVSLWPISLTKAKLLLPADYPHYFQPLNNSQKPTPVAAIQLQFDCLGEATFVNLNIESLRLYLHGDAPLTAILYEVLFNNVLEAHFYPAPTETNWEPLFLEPEQCLAPVGFARDEGLLPYPARSFLGYRLLTEYFAFPSKFLFVDLNGCNQPRLRKFQKRLEVVLFLKNANKILQGIDRQTFQLGCTPVVNLFAKATDAFELNETRFEYHVQPDVHHSRAMEVYSVDRVTSWDPNQTKTTEYQPFYSYRHGQTRQTHKAFWHISRRPAVKPKEEDAEEDPGTEVWLHLVDLDFNPRLPAESALMVYTHCTNREVAGKKLRRGDLLDLQGGIHPAYLMSAPTLPLRPPIGKGAYWRLLSHLNLNHLSISSPEEGKTEEGCEALKEILRLYNFAELGADHALADANRQVIDGIVAVNFQRVVDRTGGPISSGFARGLEITMEFAEDKYKAAGLYLFACVLERFFALYASINSFTKLIAKTRQGGKKLKEWPPRSGELPLL